MDEEEFEDDTWPQYKPIEEVHQGELFDALRRLQFFDTDMFMRQQAFNLDMVDQFLMDLERQILLECFQTDRTPRQTHFLGAQSQMWIFAAFEVLRTWDQRIRDFKTMIQHGALQARIDEIQAADVEYRHPGRGIYLGQLIELRDDPALLERALRQRRNLYVPYFRLDFIRIAMAKHEVKGQTNSKALNPGYGRINMDCGALDYELENGKYSVGYINRRQIADSLRYLDLDAEPPTDEELKNFNKFMTGKA